MVPKVSGRARQNVLLAETARVAGIERALRGALGPSRRHCAVHDPAKVATQLGYALVADGDCLSDLGILRASWRL